MNPLITANKTQIQILDSSLNVITTINSPAPLTSSNYLEYSKELSDFGQCKFRVSSYDVLFKNFSDILQPHVNHIRILRGGVTVWQGAIIENAHRTMDYVEVIAAEYEWYLNKILVQRTSIDPATGTADNIYRIFGTTYQTPEVLGQTMAQAVTTIMNETITTYKGTTGVHPLANMTLGTITNPNYPPNSTNGADPPVALTGPYVFGDGINAPNMQFDFHTILYILKSFANVSYSDFKIDTALAFNFLPFYGNDSHYDVNFTWGTRGNAVNFNVPRLGQQMANDLIGIATDINGVVLHAEQTDQTSVTTSGIIQAVAAYADIKDQATLNARVQAELPLISSPSDSPITFTLNEKAYPLGVYDIGDIVTVNVDHDFLTYSAVKRIVGITVTVDNTGRETITVQLNTPLPGQYGSVTSTDTYSPITD